MTGLEKILSQIEHESNDRCREIEENATKEAEQIINRANEQANEYIAMRKTASDKKAELITQSAQSSAQLTQNRTVLKEKLAIIDDILLRSLEVIKALPKKEYFEILKELIYQNARQGEGELRLSKEDTAKLPSNFIDSVNNSLKGSKIKLGKSIGIDSGFILVYGDIDVNCSFDAIAAAKKDELRDTLNNLLFN